MRRRGAPIGDTHRGSSPQVRAVDVEASRHLGPSPSAVHRLPAALSLALAFCAVPIVIVARDGVEFAPVDAIGPVLLVFAITFGRSRVEGRKASHSGFLLFFWASLLFALVAVSVVALGDQSGSVSTGRQLASFIFTFRPFVFLAAGAVLASRFGFSAAQLLVPLAFSAAFTSLVVRIGLWHGNEPNYQYGEVAYGGSLQFGEHLGGNYLGLALYGQFGVNSLAETYAVYVALILAVLGIAYRGRGRDRGTERVSVVMVVVLIAGLVAALDLSVSSQSRQATLFVILIVAVPAIVAGLRAYGRMERQAVIALAYMGLLAVFVLAVRRFLALEGTGYFDTFTSGRVGIAADAWAEVLERPFTGTGFARVAAQESFNAHNLVLNAAYKMGFLGGVCFVITIAFILAPSISRLWRASEAGGLLVIDLAWVLFVVAVGLVSNALDVTTAAGPLMLLVGAMNVHAGSGLAPLQAQPRESRTW